MSTLPNYVNNSQPCRPVRFPPADPHYQSIATWSNTTAITGYGHMRATSKLVKAYQVSCWICWKAKCCASSRCCRSANFERCPVDAWPTGATHSSCTSLCLQAGVLEVEDAEGKADCMQWKPFVDLRSGELKATSLRMRVYKQDANGTVTYEAANCNLKGERCNSCAAACTGASWPHLVADQHTSAVTPHVLNHPRPAFVACRASPWPPSRSFVYWLQHMLMISQS